MWRIVGLFFLSLVCATAAWGGFTGRVYVDRNHNGVFDKGERCLKGVAVSDGLNVVLTDANGIYRLDGHIKEKFLFITTPSGFYTNNTYYHSIDDDIKDYDFAVYELSGRMDKKGGHKFVQISDTEIGGKYGHEGWVNNLREYSRNENVAFIMHTGDICYESGLKSHLDMMNAENMNVPVFYSIGNHDLVDGQYGEELFESIYGPVYYSFDVGNVHYVVLPMPYGDFTPSYTREDVYKWMKNDIAVAARGKSIMIFCHDLLINGDDTILRFSDNAFIDLEEANVKAWIYGHWHVNNIMKHKSIFSVCTSSLACGGIDHASSAFRVFDVDSDGNFTSELRYTLLDKHISIASLAGDEALIDDKGSMPVYVNVYHTVSPVSKIDYTIYCGNSVVLSSKLEKATDMTWTGKCSIPKWCKGRYLTISVMARFANGEVTRTERVVFYPESTCPEVSLGDDCKNLLYDAAHSGYNKSEVVSPLKLRWINNTGGNVYMTSPLISGGKVFVATTDENFNGKAFVAAYDAYTGKELWKYNCISSVRNSMAVSDSIVFAQDVHGHLYAIDADSGVLLWKKDLEWNAIPPLNGGLIASEGVVYAGTGESLCAVEAKTGNIIWRNKDWRAREGCTVTLSADEKVLIGGSHWDAMYANDVKTGRLMWKNDKMGLRHRSSSPVIRNGIIYVLSLSSLFKIDAYTGEVIAVKGLGYNVDVTSSPLVTDKYIVFGTADRGVVAVDAATMEEKWNFKTSPSLIYSSPYSKYPACTVETSPVLSGNTVYFSASDGVIYGLQLETGRLLWKYETGAPFFASLSLSGNSLFAADFGGNVYCFTSKKE